MTVRVFIHLNSKRAETISLLDSGATKNFLNLDYTKWLKLPIKRLPFPRKLFNIDGTENKAGQLQFYTDLAIQTGSTTTNMRFFLTQLGEHKAILGYLWFAAVQPKIDWRRGWICWILHVPCLVPTAYMSDISVPVPYSTALLIYDSSLSSLLHRLLNAPYPKTYFPSLA